MSRVDLLVSFLFHFTFYLFHSVFGDYLSDVVNTTVQPLDSQSCSCLSLVLMVVLKKTEYKDRCF